MIERIQSSDQEMATESYPALTAHDKLVRKQQEHHPHLAQAAVLNNQAVFSISESSQMCPRLETAWQCHTNPGDSRGAGKDRCHCLSQRMWWNSSLLLPQPKSQRCFPAVPAVHTLPGMGPAQVLDVLCSLRARPLLGYSIFKTTRNIKYNPAYSHHN